MGSFYSHCLVRQECLSFFRAKLHVGINNCSITLSKTVSCWWQNTCKKELKRAEDREFKLCWITHVTSLCHLGLWSTHASWLWIAKAKGGLFCQLTVVQWNIRLGGYRDKMNFCAKSWSHPQELSWEIALSSLDVRCWSYHQHFQTRH